MTAAAERVFEFLDEEEETQLPAGQDAAEAQGNKPVENTSQTSVQGAAAGGRNDASAAVLPAGRNERVVQAGLPGKISGKVDFDHVRFGYNPDQIIIHDFTAHVEPGQKIAIVGPTGAGKTTIVKLLMRFYDVNSGSISLDGRDIRRFDRHELREHFAMVLQDTWLFSGTIRENIRYGRLNATDEEVEAAAKAAYVDHFIRTLPGGYDLVLNEDATNVSQGQKQLLTIARAGQDKLCDRAQAVDHPQCGSDPCPESRRHRRAGDP